MYEAMSSVLGPSHWWPGETPFEVVVGAMLTQNANWGNVERAIDNLRKLDLLAPELLYALPESDLAELIRPAGYFRLKAARLKNLLIFLKNECRFDLKALAKQELDALRPKLLAVKGVGPETADSILLYALNLPTFVVDAYTKRLLNRHGLVTEDADYEEMRELFMDLLPKDVRLYNEYHALVVRTAKEWCHKKQGRCEACPLNIFLD
jgi:endonuclease-3 related protein